MAMLYFDDGVARSLSNDRPAPADRFSNWTPKISPVGDAADALGTGRRTLFEYRSDYGASFELAGIPMRLTRAGSRHGPGIDLVETATRFCAHLLRGGLVAVDCEDLGGNVFTSCGLWPGSTPALRLADPEQLEYTLSVELVNLFVPVAPMTCRYR